jgi:hypothetical protein
MSREDPQFKLRLSEQLRDQIAESAKSSNRSMNAEIVARLEESFHPTIKGDATRAIVEDTLKVLFRDGIIQFTGPGMEQLRPIAEEMHKSATKKTKGK